MAIDKVHNNCPVGNQIINFVLFPFNIRMGRISYLVGVGEHVKVRSDVTLSARELLLSRTVIAETNKSKSCVVNVN